LVNCGICCLIGSNVSRGVFGKICLGSDISLHHSDILSIVDCDVSFLGCISGLIGSDIGRYVGGSIRSNIYLNRSCNIFRGRSILGLLNLNGIVLDSKRGCILLILLFLFNLHFFCLRRWLIEIVVHDSEIGGSCVHFLTCSGIINIENVWLERIIFFVCYFFLNLSIENLLFVIGNNFNKFVFFGFVHLLQHFELFFLLSDHFSLCDSFSIKEIFRESLSTRLGLNLD